MKKKGLEAEVHNHRTIQGTMAMTQVPIIVIMARTTTTTMITTTRRIILNHTTFNPNLLVYKTVEEEAAVGEIPMETEVVMMSLQGLPNPLMEVGILTHYWQIPLANYKPSIKLQSW